MNGNLRTAYFLLILLVTVPTAAPAFSIENTKTPISQSLFNNPKQFYAIASSSEKSGGLLAKPLKRHACFIIFVSNLRFYPADLQSAHEYGPEHPCTVAPSRYCIDFGKLTSTALPASRPFWLSPHLVFGPIPRSPPFRTMLLYPKRMSN